MTGQPTVPIESSAEIASTGYIRLNGLLSHDEVERILSDCQALLVLPAEHRHARDRPVGGTKHLDALDTRSDAVLHAATRPMLVTAVERFLGPEPKLVMAHFRCPSPGYGGQQLHTDALPKLDQRPDEAATAIIPLVAVDESNGATRVVPGSHRRPDLQRKPQAVTDHSVTLTGDAGDAFVFSAHLIHSGTTNLSQRDRPALQLRWEPKPG